MTKCIVSPIVWEVSHKLLITTSSRGDCGWFLILLSFLTHIFCLFCNVWLLACFFKKQTEWVPGYSATEGASSTLEDPSCPDFYHGMTQALHRWLPRGCWFRVKSFFQRNLTQKPKVHAGGGGSLCSGRGSASGIREAWGCRAPDTPSHPQLFICKMGS